nr:hypothetical protein [Pseudomonadota bacterium]
RAVFVPPDTEAWALAKRFTLFISRLRVAVGGAMEDNGPLMTLGALIWNRLTDAANRFAVIAAQPVARTRCRPPEPAPEPENTVSEDAVSEDGTPVDPFPSRRLRARPKKPLRLLPRGYGWLARMGPDLVPYGIEFAYLLAQPEMAELLATAPRLWRVLRPICRMFGIMPPETLPPPPPRPARRAPVARPDPVRMLRLSDAAAAREYGPQGFRPPLFGR